jgi:cytochrome P450
MSDLVYNPYSESFRMNPFPVYQRFLEESPVHHLEEDRWIVFRYRDARKVLCDDELMYKYPEKMLGRFPPEGWYHEYNANGMAFKDPPEHTRIRKSIARAFIPRQMEKLKPSIEQVARALLDDLEDPAHFDLVQQFAFLLPLIVICEMMDVPREDWVLFRRCATALVDGLEPIATEEDYREADRGAGDLYEYLSVLVNERRKNTGDDLISRLISYGKEDRLSHDEVVHNASFLLSAGHETTSSLIGNGIMALNRFPEQMELLQADPSLTVNAVEEFLRFDPPLRSVPRYNRRDFQVDGVTIPAGSMIIACIASANRDPEQFPNPDTLEITRSNANTHLAFSGGIHMCLGHKLARLEGAVAFSELFSRYRKIEISGKPVKRAGVTFSGMAELPVHAG